MPSQLCGCRRMTEKRSAAWQRSTPGRRGSNICRYMGGEYVRTHGGMAGDIVVCSSIRLSAVRRQLVIRKIIYCTSRSIYCTRVRLERN